MTDTVFEGLKSNSTVAMKEPLFFSQREGRVLVVEPETASWAVLDGPSIEILNALRNPLSLFEMEQKYPHIDRSTLTKFITQLYKLQFVSCDGAFCHDPLKLWETKNKYPYYINIHVTSRCNFACTYCYNATQAGGNDMTLATANYLQRRLFLELPQKHITFQFHGGEPLLFFHKVIVPFAAYAETLSKRYCKTTRILIQSNASLITEDMAKTIKTMDLGLGVSIDGDEHSHNAHRVYPDGRGTYEDAKRGLDRIMQVHKHIAPLACIQEPSQYSSFISHFTKEGISDFVIRPAYPIGRGKDKKGITPDNAGSFAGEFIKTPDIIAQHNSGKTFDYYCTDHKESRRTVFRNITYFLELLVSRERPNMCYRSPCGAGNCIIAFDTNGDIYPCEEMVAYKKFKIGNIYQRENIASAILESDAYQILNNRMVEHLEGCRECPWRRFCGGGCPAKIAASGESMEYGDHYCTFNKIVLEELAWKIAQNPSLAADNLTLEYLQDHPIDQSLWNLSVSNNR